MFYLKKSSAEKLSVIGTIIILIIGSQSCSKLEPEEIDDGSTKISESAIIFTESEWDNAVKSENASGNTFTFTEDHGFDIGDVIVSEAGDGYLRKITNIQQSGNDIIVSTNQAILTDVIERGDISFTFELTADQIEEDAYLKKGTTVKASNYKDENGVEFIDYDLYTEFADGLVEVTGNFLLKPTLTTDWEIDDFEFKLIDAQFDIVEKLYLGAIVNLDDAFNFEDKIYSHKFRAFTVWAGGIPVRIRPIIDFYAGITSNHNKGITTSVTQELYFEAGIRYNDSEWTHRSELTKTLNFSEPNLSSEINVTAYIRPELRIKVSGVIAPYVTGRFYCELDANTFYDPWWTLYLGATGTVGLKGLIFGLIDYEIDPPPIYFKTPIAYASGPYVNPGPDANFTADKTTIYAGESVQFTDQTTNNPTFWKWEFGDGFMTPVQNPIHIYDSPGVYDVSLTVSNSDGSDTETKTKYITVNNQLQLVIQPGPEDGKDADVILSRWSDGDETYSGIADGEELYVHYDHLEGNNASESESLIEFSLSKLPANATIVNAQLEVFGSAVTNYGLYNNVELSVSKLLSYWNESTVKWDTKPASEFITYLNIVTDMPKSWINCEITSFVADWHSNGENYGIRISTSTNTFSGFFYSSDHSDTSKRPKLTILYY